jgi:hypothetical protein
MIKVGRTVIDPMNRRVTIIAFDKATQTVTVKCAGPHGTTIQYPASCLRVEEA